MNNELYEALSEVLATPDYQDLPISAFPGLCKLLDAGQAELLQANADYIGQKVLQDKTYKALLQMVLSFGALPISYAQQFRHFMAPDQIENLRTTLDSAQYTLAMARRHHREQR